MPTLLRNGTNKPMRWCMLLEPCINCGGTFAKVSVCIRWFTSGVCYIQCFSSSMIAPSRVSSDVAVIAVAIPFRTTIPEILLSSQDSKSTRNFQLNPRCFCRIVHSDAPSCGHLPDSGVFPEAVQWDLSIHTPLWPLDRVHVFGGRQHLMLAASCGHNPDLVTPSHSFSSLQTPPEPQESPIALFANLRWLDTGIARVEIINKRHVKMQMCFIICKKKSESKMEMIL